MSKVVSVINLKGGVGKTTVTVALAEFLVVEHNLKVLVIDLDPQTNATVALIGEKEWGKRNKKGLTLFNLFKDHIDDTSTFDLEQSIVKKTSNLQGGLSNLHLLPSSLDFIQIQDRLINIGQTALMRPIDVLKKAVKDRLDDYDIVLIDCPPNLGIVTQNGLNISDSFLIPVIPNRLSTYGIPQILTSVKSFNRRTESNVQPLGVVISMFRSNVQNHTLTKNQLEAQAQEGKMPRIFKTIIPLASKVSDATDYELVGINTLKQKYGWSGSNSMEAFTNLTREFMQYVGL
ncbi:AAA family ATPase [Brevibacillus fulvus]|uniref:Chromosome partitioning protein n=1 Tax=Brevibacillus fulvus TaxID=1125967 RepID=A0A939BTF2_9BACL|nr:chromosome partitioning protein [Brevibacillus fulvus]